MLTSALRQVITRLRLNKEDKQSGINMVDLMMWLVIAALLLAAAIQGIGYYQKAAYLYHVKNDVMGGATKVLSVSGIDHLGKVDESIVDEGLDITKTTRDVVLASDTDPNGNPMIRGTHPGIPGKEVVYFFEGYGVYLPNQVYVVADGAIPQGSDDNSEDGTPAPDAGGETSLTVSPNGDVDGDGIPNSTDTDVDGDGTENTSDDTPNGTTPEDLSAPGAGDGTTAATVGTISGDGSGDFVDMKDNEDYDHAHEPLSSNMLQPGQAELVGWDYDPAKPHEVMITTWTDGQERGMGGSHHIAFHADYTCVHAHDNSIVKKGSGVFITLMDEPYWGEYPGPNTTTKKFACTYGYILTDVVLRGFTQTEWENYSTGSYPSVWTRDIVEGWYNPSF